MKKLKSWSPLVAALILSNALEAKAEYHVVLPGEVLSVIAEQKRVKSGFVLSTEQIMLTLYQLNKNVFVNGDINQLIIASKILIPDNTNDYLQLTKIEAQQQLQNKNYLKEQSSNSGIASNGSQGSNYAQVLGAIDDLKTENKRLVSKFNLIERALGRMVSVQGALTNEVVQIKTKIAEVETQSPVARENGAKNDPGQLHISNSVVGTELNTSPVVTDIKPETVTEARVPEEAPVIQNEANIHVKEAPLTLEQIAALESSAPIVGKTAPPIEAATSAANADDEPIAAVEVPVKRIVMRDDATENEGNLLLQGAMVFGAILAALVAWWGVKFYKTRRKGIVITQSAADTVTLVAVQPVFEGNGLSDELLEPVKSIIEKSQQAAKEGVTEIDLEDIIELLDMCLLCGDYEQAHRVTVKALAENKSSTILTQKLSLIERKMATAG